MHVSTVTIRQDLRTLEENGLLERTYGGAVRRENTAVIPELSFHVRLSKKRRDKDAIAAHAVDIIRDGYSIALDASTTAYAMVSLIKGFRKITVVTNSLVIAQQFLDAPHIQVFIPGGRLRRDSISIVGSPDALPDINLNVGFFGARGVAISSGITDVDADEVSLKQAMMARCVSPVVLVDGSKWGQVAPYTFARLSQIERIITSDDAPIELIAAVRSVGTRVDVVSVNQRNGA